MPADVERHLWRFGEFQKETHNLQDADDANALDCFTHYMDGNALGIAGGHGGATTLASPTKTENHGGATTLASPTKTDGASWNQTPF